MAVRGKTLFTKTLIWLAAEIVLNLMGLDTLADYSEFVFDRNILSYLASDRQIQITTVDFQAF